MWVWCMGVCVGGCEGECLGNHSMSRDSTIHAHSSTDDDYTQDPALNRES